MNEPFAPPIVPARAATEPVFFYDERPRYRRMVLRGAMLELVTVGFYRFWLATDMRRHLWSHTAVGGDTAEYTGTARELLIGFLFAVAILAPIYFVYFLLGLEAERYKAFASVPMGLFFYLFTQFAVYRARRYRLTRTVWRGVRFWMTRLRLELRLARRLMDAAGLDHARHRTAVAPGRARALQDAAHVLRPSAAAVSSASAASCSSAAGACGRSCWGWWPCRSSSE